MRGLNSSVRQDSMKDFVISSQVDVICIQETKMQTITRGSILSMLGVEFTDYVFLPFFFRKRRRAAYHYIKRKKVRIEKPHTKPNKTTHPHTL
jgi:exonuclease III